MESLLLRVLTQKRGWDLSVHGDFCQLLLVSDYLSLGTISNLPKHLGLLILFRDCSTDVSKDWERCMKFKWLQINKAPISKDWNFQDEPMIPPQLCPAIHRTAACERTAKHKALLSRGCLVIHWCGLACKANVTLTACESSCTHQKVTRWWWILLPNAHSYFCVCVRAFFFVVSQGTWERILIIHPHKVLPPHQDIIHLIHKLRST